MGAPTLTDMFVNGYLDCAAIRLVQADTLDAGVSAFEQSCGSTAERLEVAVLAMLRAARVPVDVFDLPADLESMTVGELTALAEREEIAGMSTYRRKDEIIRKIRSEHANRIRMRG